MPGGAVRVLLLGPVPYSLALRVQERCVGAARAAALGAAAAAAPPPPQPPQQPLVLSEPAEPVYAWGLRGAPGVSLAAKLREKGAGLAAVRRGGHVTYHGPGQLLALVVLDLRARRLGLRGFVGGLEEVGVRLCRRLGVPAATARPPPLTGVWVGDGKVAAIGVHCGHYITSHGLALNCCTDLAWFEHIVPCGLEGMGVTSLSRELGRHVPVADVLQPFLHCFQEVFGCALVFSDEPEA
ncbi:putative lipoyltransferase 2, mitochondrial [Aythya fuligula]|uniref:Octanoyl-[acyl-carrier-protein]:protein N-octanoyltransferase LIPT2, mitochondrial n=1 Tax=Aythya fuligula TaxID=219594 RepID=A0A6J3DTG3_AYTFU|nr:putative lipoyltransferase 2, mitochondrial [Aythya fuligula]